ncbi:MAG: pantoate--beta-alanine ligase [Opitutales bacterium]|nr:pantoate--beta-alanine ligase [Opitutales bacterium]
MSETESTAPQVFRDIAPLQQHLQEVRREGRKIALVPTMGALHEGHLALVRKALEVAEEVVVTIFVNPTQFGPSEDLASYPRNEEADLQALGKLGKFTIFIPAAEEMYPADFSTFIDEAKLSKGLCGVSRPQFFRGVLTIVGKLFNIVHPDVAVFGQKDAQQAAVIQKMVRDLHFGVEILTHPTVREEDGLAMSSRNQYLSNAQREEARALSKSLFKAKQMVEEGVCSTDRVIAEVTHLLSQHRRVRLIYAQIVDSETLEARREIVPGKSLFALAAWVDQVRLIDNIQL